MIHDLKIYTSYFQDVQDRKKNFEIRFNDRNFKVGDILLLREYLPDEDKFTGKSVEREVVYITDYAQRDGFVVMGIT